jgi:hypothetical protein
VELAELDVDSVELEELDIDESVELEELDAVEVD